MTVQIVRLETSEAIEIISPEHSKDVQIETTSQPIEQGAPASDHAQAKLTPLRIRGVIAGSPLVRPERNIPDSPEAALDFLERVEEQPIRVETERLGTFEQALLSGYSPTESSGDALDISITIKEVRFAELERVALPSVERDVGQQPTEPREPEKSGLPDPTPGLETPALEALGTTGFDVGTSKPTDKEVGGSWLSGAQTVQ